MPTAVGHDVIRLASELPYRGQVVPGTCSEGRRPEASEATLMEKGSSTSAQALCPKVAQLEHSLGRLQFGRISRPTPSTGMGIEVRSSRAARDARARTR